MTSEFLLELMKRDLGTDYILRFSFLTSVVRAVSCRRFFFMFPPKVTSPKSSLFIVIILTGKACREIYAWLIAETEFRLLFGLTGYLEFLSFKEGWALLCFVYSFEYWNGDL